MKGRNTTMSDVANKAGVSITTVSHVINKTRNVNQETRNAVLKAMDQLEYRSKKSPRDKRMKHIGVIVADIREDYFVSVIKAIETAATDYNISIVFCDSEDDPVKEEKNIETLLDRKVDGLIMAPIETGKVPLVLNKSTTPVVLFDRQYEKHPYLFVGINNINSSYLGSRYLHAKGCNYIGFIGYSETVFTIRQRIIGYKAFLAEQVSQTKPKVLALSYHKEDSYPLIKSFIENEKLDGIICATSTVCYEVVNVLKDLSIDQKSHLKIISYDDNRWLDYIMYPISVISQPTVEIGIATVENLVQILEQHNDRTGIRRELLFDVDIIDRL